MIMDNKDWLKMFTLISRTQYLLHILRLCDTHKETVKDIPWPKEKAIFTPIMLS